MNCNNKKRKISDLLDGKLHGNQRSILEKHISQCPSCKEYKNQLKTISSKVKEREIRGIPENYAQEFAIKLKRQLLDEQRKNKQTNTNNARFPSFEKWAYGTVGFVVVLFLVLYFVVLQPSSFWSDEFYVLSYENAIGNLYGEIDNDAELEELFNSILTASLNEALNDLDEKTLPFILENSFYEDERSDENLKYIHPEIKQKREEDIKS